MVGGATLTKLIGTSAWYAPGAAGAALVESIVRDQKKLFTCCVSLEWRIRSKKTFVLVFRLLSVKTVGKRSLTSV